MKSISARLVPFAIAALCWTGTTVAGEIAKPLGVVELFTSQGCSSCPPADAFLGELARRGDVIALAYHVDYWDYLGWKDNMARPENTQRQKAYQASLDNAWIYTPQAVVNGRNHVTGSRSDAILSLLDNDAKAGSNEMVDVAITREHDMLGISVGGARGAVRNARVIVVYFDPVREVAVKRGENRGRTVEYWNAVTGWHTAGMWHGEPVRFELPEGEIEAKGGGGCAVLVQAFGPGDMPGPVIGSAMLTY